MNNGRDNDSFRTSTDIYTGHDTNYSDMYQLDADDAGKTSSDEENVTPVKKKKRRKKHYMLRIFLFFAAVALNYFFLTTYIFYI